MDPEELYEFKKQELNMFIPYVGKHIEAWKDIKDEKDAVIIKLSGLSNITCMIKANDKHVEPRSVIFRVFDNPLCESDVEDLVFQWMSDHGIGPKCYYKCDHYRIEEWYDSRPITIFEMRNPVFLKKIIEIAFKINYNKDIKEKFIEIKGGEHQTQIDVLYDKWLPQLFDKFDHLYKLITVKEYIEIMDNMKEKWLTEDIYEYINALRFRLHLDKNDLVVSHNDIQELNVLSLKTWATKLVVIDYEYKNTK